mgnify:CR=1 FL=1|jgi:putative (di)nucleoside polyphosphate hydrolase
MIDSQGYRANVGIVLHNDAGQLFWCKRAGQDAWQFPQGGITENESPEEALYRELREETGLTRDDVEIVASSREWLKYRLPPHLVRRKCFPKCIGQKQRWFLLRMVSDESCINLQHTDEPEFDGWEWVDYWKPLDDVVFFKRKVYKRALTEFADILRIANPY